MITKKSYIPFAKSLGKYFRKKDYFDGAIDETAKMDITDLICSNLKQDNPNFNATRFRDAIQEAREEN
ncbi:hypothetical protein LCGC14_0739600 [marine sediment metagenome]|uniref:Uncharacterized protein n=1 Tax=marine sediment metagenome TaxID=412755 RepID=A0A0F9TEG6_9ZZZZ